jgi:hypothetical protein
MKSLLVLLVVLGSFFAVPEIRQTAGDCDRVAEGRSFLWFCGVIKYADIFEKSSESGHETRFCYVWEPKTRMTPEPSWRYIGGADHNRST